VKRFFLPRFNFIDLLVCAMASHMVYHEAWLSAILLFAAGSYLSGFVQAWAEGK
jgi:hypothetical protein